MPSSSARESAISARGASSRRRKTKVRAELANKAAMTGNGRSRAPAAAARRPSGALTPAQPAGFGRENASDPVDIC